MKALADAVSILFGNRTPKKALEIQKKFEKNMEVLMVGTPVMGPVRDVLHQITKDEERGWEAIKSASSTTGSANGGVLEDPELMLQSIAIINERCTVTTSHRGLRIYLTILFPAETIKKKKS